MSLLVNNINFNNVVQTKNSFSKLEKEKSNIKEIKFFLIYYKKKQKITNDRIMFDSNLLKNKNILIKSLNKTFLKNYFNFLLNPKKKKQYNEFIHYAINVSIFKKNTAIYISDTKGQLKMYCSASLSLKLLGKQKIIQPKVLISLLKHLVNKIYFSKNKIYFSNKEKLPIALHLRYVKKNFLKLIITKLKKNFSIKTINFSNFYPHNGCRYKKIRRLKHRKKNIKIKKAFIFVNYNKKLWKPFLKKRFKKKLTKNNVK